MSVTELKSQIKAVDRKVDAIHRQRGELQIALAAAEYKANRPKNLRFMTESQKLKLALRELKSLVKHMEYPKFPAAEKALYLELAHKAIDRIEAA